MASIEANLTAVWGNSSLKVIEWLSEDDFEQQVQGSKFRIIYLGAHADLWGFGEEGQPMHPWENLADVICQTDCMLPEGILILGCCRGGMKTVALKILKSCNKIDYIFGPNWKTKGGDLVIAFTTFIRNTITNEEEPCVSAKRASDATGQKFNCYDRQEFEAELEMMRMIEHISYVQTLILSNQELILKRFNSSYTMEVPPP